MPITVKSTGGGSVTLTAPVTGSDLTLTMPSISGTIYATTGGVIPVSAGGTGLSSTPANGALDIGNGTGFTRATLTAGSGISVTNGAGSITIAATGGGTVTSVATGTGLTGGTITTSGTISLVTTVGAVGTYALLNLASSQSTTNPGGTTAGSNLRYTNVEDGASQFGTPPSGTWQCNGYILDQCQGSGQWSTLWIRIA
jgi:hypothetical protein